MRKKLLLSSAKKLLILSFIVVFFGALTGEVYAADGDSNQFWVRKDGNDTCSGQNNQSYAENSTDCAWASITKAGNALVVGQTVRVQVGHYGNETVVVNNSGTAGNRITFKADGNVTLESNYTNTKAFDLNSQDYIMVDGFRILKYGTGIYYQNSDYAYILNNLIGESSVFNGGNTGLGINNRYSDNTRIENNIVYNSGLYNIYVYVSDNVTLKNNVIYDNDTIEQTNPDTRSDYGFRLNNMTNSYSENNTVYNIGNDYVGHAWRLRHSTYNNTFVNDKAYNFVGYGLEFDDNASKNTFIDIILDGNNSNYPGAVNSGGWSSIGVAIKLRTHNNTFTNLTVKNLYKGVDIRAAYHSASMWGYNVCTDESTGGYLGGYCNYESRDNKVINSTFENIEYAAFRMYSPGNTMEGNRIVAGSTYDYYIEIGPESEIINPKDTSFTIKLNNETSTLNITFTNNHIFSLDNNEPITAGFDNTTYYVSGITNTITVTKYNSTINATGGDVRVNSFSTSGMTLDYYNQSLTYVNFTLSPDDPISSFNITLDNVTAGTTFDLNYANGTLIDTQTASSTVYFNDSLSDGSYYITVEDAIEKVTIGMEDRFQKQPRTVCDSGCNYEQIAYRIVFNQSYNITAIGFWTYNSKVKDVPDADYAVYLVSDNNGRPNSSDVLTSNSSFNLRDVTFQVAATRSEVPVPEYTVQPNSPYWIIFKQANSTINPNSSYFGFGQSPLVNFDLNYTTKYWNGSQWVDTGYYGVIWIKTDIGGVYGQLKIRRSLCCYVSGNNIYSQIASISPRNTYYLDQFNIFTNGVINTPEDDLYLTIENFNNSDIIWEGSIGNRTSISNSYTFNFTDPKPVINGVSKIRFILSSPGSTGGSYQLNALEFYDAANSWQGSNSRVARSQYNGTTWPLEMLTKDLQAHIVAHLDTVIDTTPPAPLTNLENQFQDENWIYWNWSNPTDSDFNHTEVWINGTFYANVSNSFNYYNATGLNPDTWYEIQTRTWDVNRNVNTNWVNDTAKTLEDTTAPVIIFVSPTPNNKNTSNTWAYINVTMNEVIHTAILEWNETNNETTWDGNVLNTNFFINKTNLNGNYTFKVYANDSSGNIGFSEIRWVNANVTDTQRPTISIRSPQDITYSYKNISLNYTADEPLDTCLVSVDGTANQTLNCKNQSVISREYESTAGTIGWYHFNENGGNNVADSSEDGNNGTINGTSWTTGKFGSGLQFDGNNDYVTIPDDGSLNIDGSSFSITAWIYVPNTDAGFFISKGDEGGAGNVMHVGTNYDSNDDIDFHFWGGDLRAGNAIPAYNEWFHVAFTYNSTDNSRKIFVNGVRKASDTATSDIINTNGEDLILGKDQPVDRYWKGKLDEVRVLNRALTEEEIKSDYTLSTGSHSITVYANDTAGNWNSTTIYFTVFDKFFRSLTPANGSIVDTNYIYINVTLFEAPDWIRLEWNNGPNESMMNSSGTNWYKNKTNLENGGYSFKVWTNDSFGNMNVSETRVVTVAYSPPSGDTTPPTSKILSPSNGTWVNGIVTLTASAVDLDTGVKDVQFQYCDPSNFTCYNVGSADTSSPYEVNWDTSSLPDISMWYLRAVPTDNADNTNWTVTNYTMKIDHSIPIISSQDTIYPGSQYAIRNGQNVTLRVNVTDDGNGSGIFNVSVDASSIGGLLSPMVLIAGGSGSYQTGTFEKNITVNAPDGTNLLTITSYDNSSPLPNIASGINFIVEVDNTKPVIISDISVTFGSPATISWTTDENSTSLVKYGTQSGVYTSSIYDPSYNTAHSITLTDASSPGTTYYFVVNSSDGAGNSIQSGEYSFTINDSINSETPSSPSGGGGGGGGGGATSFEVWIRDVSAGQTFSLEVDDEDIPYINGLSLTAKQDIYSSKLSITDLDKKPWYGMAEPDGSVLRYFKVGYDKNNYVESAKFKVSVNKSWLKDNDIDPYKFVLYHYTTTWEELDSEILKEDDENIYFEAATPGFSYFSLGGESGSGYRSIVKGEEGAPVEKETENVELLKGTGEKTDVPSLIPVTHKTKPKAEEIIKTDTVIGRIFQFARDGLPIAAVLLLIGGIFSYAVKRKGTKGPSRKGMMPEEERPKPLLDPKKMQIQKDPDGKI